MLKPITLLLCLASLASAQAATGWPQFLGPGSRAIAVDASSLPPSALEFDRDSSLRFRTTIPAGASSPCVQDGRVFLTGLDDDELVMLAIDAKTGKELWRHGVPAPKDPKFAHKDSGVAMCTACTNGRRVFFHFPSYGLIARNVDGTPAWEKRLPAPRTSFGIGSSPSLCGDNVILLRDGCPDAKLYALNEKTGKVTWSVPRPTAYESHSTPFIWQNRERREIVIASTGAVTSFDPESGESLWRVTGLTPLICTTPTASADRLYFAGWSTPAAPGVDRLLDGMKKPIELTKEEREDPEALFRRFDKDGDGKMTKAEAPEGRVRDAWSFFDRNSNGTVEIGEWAPLVRMPTRGKNVLVAIEPGGDGDITKTHVKWTVRRGIPYVSSPLLYDGRLYMIKAGGVLSCVDPATGKPRFKRSRLDDRSEYYATPIGVDGHVVVCSSAGKVYVLEAKDELKIIRTVDLEEPVFATPAVAHGAIYVRTQTTLYAFAGRQPAPVKR